MPTTQGVNALTLMQQTMRFDLENGFPLITERNIASFWRKPIAELCAFINGATTTAALQAFGCDWWGPWASSIKTAPLGLSVGDLGPGSYGGAFKAFPTEDGHEFDQFDHLVRQMREIPLGRSHFITPWIPQYNARAGGKIPKVTVSPCHGWIHVRVLQSRIHLHMFQRAGDMLIGVPANMIQYGALLLMLEQLTGFRAHTLYQTISDAHVYEDQLSVAAELLTRQPRPYPVVHINQAGLKVSDIHDFRAEHFCLDEYFPHESIPDIPIAV